MGSLKKKTQQLGMSYFTAVGRLQRRLLFKMAQQLGLDVCHRCSQRIEVIEQFSIEHKQPWLDVSPDLFWDLDNIAFSHHRCNSRAIRWSREQQNRDRVDHHRDAPSGTAWCFGHKRHLSKDEFNVNSSRPSGTQRYCKECRRNGIGRATMAQRTTAPVL